MTASLEKKLFEGTTFSREKEDYNFVFRKEVENRYSEARWMGLQVESNGS